MNDFIFDVPVKIYFGKNQLSNLSSEIKKYGSRVLLTYGGGSIKKMGLYDKIITELKNADLEVFELSGIEPNPRIQSVRAGADICKKNNVDVILAVGGGSTIDASKFIAAGACVDFDPWEFFINSEPITKALPLISVLTLSATGSEMNCGGVVSNIETADKIGKQAEVLLPKASFLDPSNTFTVSKYQTACGAADILSHVIEVYFNNENDLYMLDCFMEGLMKTVIKYSKIALQDPTNYEARANIMWASTWAINGLISGGKQHAWSCHTMEHQLSAVYDISHGLGLAIIMPRWLEYCLDESNVDKYYQFGTNVFDIDKSLDKMTVAKMSIKMFADFLFNDLGLDSTLSKLNITDEKFEFMAKKACKGNPQIFGFKTLTPKDVENIYKMCL